MMPEDAEHKSPRTFSAKSRAERQGQVNQEEQRIDADRRARIAAEYGEPVIWRVNNQGERTGITSVTAVYFAKLYSEQVDLIWDVEEERFFRYSDKLGIWEPYSAEKNLADIARMMVDEARRNGMEYLAAKSCLKLHREIQTYLKAFIDKRSPFVRDPYAAERNIVFKNGVFTIREGRLEGFREDFRPDDWARNQIPVDYDPDATCNRVVDELLRPGLDPRTAAEDIELMFQFLGLFLLGYNVPQRILLLDGSAGAGKSTFAKLACLLVGARNVSSLRTTHLGGKFETSGFLGKTLLVAPDVPEKFLLQQSTSMLKSLVGGDPLEAEIKGARDRVSFQGTFNVIVTSNSKLRVKLEHDVEAWRRRLAVVSFQNHKPSTKISHFEKVLFREEGSGIVNRALQGLEQFFESGGADLSMTSAQLERVEVMLARSNPVGEFLDDRVREREGACLAKKRLRLRFQEYCKERRWSLPSDREINATLREQMLERFGVPEVNSIPDPDEIVGNVAGFRGVDWVSD